MDIFAFIELERNTVEEKLAGGQLLAIKKLSFELGVFEISQVDVGSWLIKT